MCATCGCGEDQARVSTAGPVEPATVGADRAGHAHAREHTHAHGHGDGQHGDGQHGDGQHGDGQHGDGQQHTHPQTHTLRLEQDVLGRNDHLAEHNRAWLRERGVRAVNLMSSPGAGKTTLLERTIREAGLPVGVIEGDQETLLDAERIRAAGARAVQVNTGAGCHLDADMVRRALDELAPEPNGLVFVENVGNLVCPALFDLGESSKVVVISVTEGDDKPLKYPHMFAAADLVVVNKTDLLPYVDFDLDRLESDARRLNPGVTVLPVSARTGENLASWYAWFADPD